MHFVDFGSYEKWEKVFLKFSNQIYKFFSFLLYYSCFVMRFLNNKTSANWFNFMSDSKDLFYICRGNLSTNMKGSLWNFSAVLKLCVQMNQSVQEISLLRDFFIDTKYLIRI